MKKSTNQVVTNVKTSAKNTVTNKGKKSVKAKKPVAVKKSTKKAK